MDLADRVIQRYKGQGGLEGDNNEQELADRVISRFKQNQTPTIQQKQPEDSRGVFQRFIDYTKDIGRELYTAGKETGAASVDVASRLTPIEGARNLISGFSEVSKGNKSTSLLDRFQKGVLDSQSRQTLFEKVRGTSLTDETGKLKPEEAKMFIGRAMEAPTYFFSGLKGLGPNGSLISRVASRTKAVVPEAAVMSAIQKFEDKDSSFLKNLGANTIFMSAIANVSGEVGRVLSRKTIKKISEETNVPEDKVEKAFDIVKNEKDRMVNLREGERPKIEIPSQTRKIEVKTPEARGYDVDKVIKDSGFVDYTIRKEKNIPTIEGGKAKGRARFDFKNQRGIIEVSSKADPKTKAHEFAHVVNYRLGTNKEKLSTELNQFINGTKKDVPKTIAEYAKKNGQDPETFAKELSQEIRKAARIDTTDTFKSMRNPSEEFSIALSNAITKSDQIAQNSPKWASFVENEVIQAKRPKKTAEAKFEAPMIKKIENNEKIAREYVRSKGTTKLRTAKEAALMDQYKRLQKSWDNATDKSARNRISKAMANVVKEIQKQGKEKFRTYEKTVSSEMIGGIRRDAKRHAIEKYKKMIKNGEKIDPIMITDAGTMNIGKRFQKPKKGQKFEVVDGNHRLIAMKEMGKNDIPVIYVGEKNKFRLKDDFKKATGIDITNAQEKEIMALNKKIFGDEDVKITAQILANRDALGSYKDGMIKIVKGQADAKDTFYHEAVHKYLDVFTNEDQQVDLLLAAQKRYKTKDFNQIEERLAEDFIKYAKSREGVVGKIKQIFDSVLGKVDKYFGNEDKIANLYSDIVKGKGREIIKETKRTVRVKAPAKITAGGKVSKEIKPIKSESIKLDKLNTSDDVKGLINRFSTADKEVIDRQRRGKITNKELDELASMTGLKPEDIMKAEAGSIVNAENAVAARRMMVTMAEDITETVKNFPASPSREQILMLRDKMNKFRGVQKSIAGFRSEAGRLLQSYKTEVIPEEYDIYESMIKQISKIDQEEANSIQKAVKLGKTVQPDTMYQLAIKSGVEARTAFLLYSPTTHVANIIGNTWQALTAPLKKFIASRVGKGVAKDEASAHISGIKDAMPEAWSLLKDDIKKIFKGQEITGFEKTAEVTNRQRSLYELLRKKGVSENKADKIDSIIKSSFKLLTASDKFFRTINFAGELYSQSIRKATKEGLTGDKLVKRINELIDNPSADREFFEAIQKQVDISLFQEKTKASTFINKIRDEYPSSKIFVPFVQTPLNVAIESIRTSPLGFFRSGLNKRLGKEMTQAEKSMANAQATIGSALAAVGLFLVADDKITGAPPKNFNERDEFYASGKQPYSVKIGNKWYSYRRIEPMASVLANTANAYKTTKEADNWQKAIGQATSGYVSNFLDQTFLKGISDAYNAVTDPDRYGDYFVQSYVTSLIPSISRSIAGASDRTLRERETLMDSIKNVIPGQKGTLPAKIDIFGKEVKREGGFVEGFLSPFYRSTEKEDKTIKALENSEYNLTTYRLDEIKGVRITGKAKEAWLKIVGQQTKESLDKLTSSTRFQNMSQSEKDDALKETVSEVRTKLRNKASSRLKQYFRQRSDMTKKEQKKYDDEVLKGKLEEEIGRITNNLK